MNVISFGEPFLDEKEAKAVSDVIMSKWIRMGPRVLEFEENIARTTQAKHAVAVSSCTAGLHILLLALGVASKEVIVPSFTFAATVNVIALSNAKPVFAEVNPETLTLDPKDVEKRITPKTKAILPVHLFGNPCEMKEIQELAENHDLAIIEDCAHALGSLYRGKSVGIFDKGGCFSFDTLKNVTTGEGGMIITDEDEIARRARILRDHGRDEEGNHILPGLNYKMTDLQAAVGLVQLKKLGQILAKRRALARLYSELMKDWHSIRLPIERNETKHSYTFYTLIVNDENIKAIDLFFNLRDEGVQTKTYRPVHLEPAYQQYRQETKLPITESICQKSLSLPLYPNLSDSDVLRVVQSLKKHAAGKSSN